MSAISASKASSWSFAEEFVAESEAVTAARDRAAELGVAAVSPGTGALLGALAAAGAVRSAVDVGTGAGVSGLWLLEGMPADGVLTTIDLEAEHQAAARRAFADAGVRSNRTRVISGEASDVLPRLTDSAYDLVHLDVDAPRTALRLVPEALRLLRPHGTLVVSDALAKDRVPDPAQRDQRTTAARELLRTVQEDDRLRPLLLPTGDGVLVAVRRPA